MIPGFNSKNETMDGISHELRSQGFRVLRVLLTQNPEVVRRMTATNITDIMDRSIDKAYAGSDGATIGAFHSLPGLVNAHVANLRGRRLNKTIEFAPPYRLRGFWHRFAQVLGSIPLPQFVLRQRLPSWNEHAPGPDPHESRRVHKDVPVSAYHAVFGIYNAVRRRGIQDNAPRLLTIDPKDELVCAKGSEAFLRLQPKGVLKKMLRIARTPKRGELYHHNLDEESMRAEEWDRITREMREFLDQS